MLTTLNGIVSKSKVILASLTIDEVSYRSFQHPHWLVKQLLDGFICFAKIERILLLLLLSFAFFVYVLNETVLDGSQRHRQRRIMNA